MRNERFIPHHRVEDFMADVIVAINDTLYELNQKNSEFEVYMPEHIEFGLKIKNDS